MTTKDWTNYSLTAGHKGFLSSRRFVFTKENLVDLTVVLWFCNAPLKTLVHIPLSIIGLAGLTIAVANILTYLPLFLYVLLARRLPCKHFLCLYVIVALFFAATLALHPDYQYWYDRDIYGVAYTLFRPDHGAIWAVLMVELCGNPKRLFGDMKIIAVIVFLHNLLLAYSAMKTGYWTYYSETGLVAQRSYDLDFGYNMAFVAIIAMVSALLDRKRIMWLVVILCIVLDFRFGSRGSLLCVLSLICFWVLFADTSPIRKFFCITALVLVSVIFLSNASAILYSVADFLQGVFGIQSRTVTSILQGELLDDNGREGIYQLAQSALNANPYGYGAYGDRAIIGPYYFWGYCHNIYYEMAINFGVVPAVLLLLAIVIASLFCMVKAKDNYFRILVMISLSMCMRLLVSDTFWGNNFFWLLIGVLIAFYCDLIKVKHNRREVDS